MSSTYRDRYYYYLTPDRQSIGLIDSDGAFVTSSDVRVIYTKHDTALTLDTDEPTFDSTYHMAIVYKVMDMLGFTRYSGNYRKEKIAARHSKVSNTMFIKQQDY